MKQLIVFFLVVLLSYSAEAQYDAIDQYVKTVVVADKDDIQSLSSKITARSTTEIEKVRAIFIWIVSNIDYDVRSYLVGGTPELNPMTVARKKIAVCQGYSNLFKALCLAKNIETYTVSGFSKGYGLANRKKLERAEHMWNIVKVEGKWFVLDVTWAAGYLNYRGVYVKKFQPRYFLSDPSDFITQHLPEDPMWQLLKCPITPAEFLKDSAKVYQLALSKKECFNFNDTLQYYTSLNFENQAIASADRMIRFFPGNTYTAAIMVNQVAYNYSLLLNNKDASLDEKKEAAQKSQQYYQKAYDIARHSKSDKQLLQMIKQNLENVNVFIKLYENQ